jgi:WS/DGAT/MGAT family acyltransferase
MRRLTAADAMFLYNESPCQHMHTLKLAIMDHSRDPGGYSFEVVKDRLRGRLDRLPPLRWRVVSTPLGLNHPLWIEDPDFDLDYHLRRAAVPAPGGMRELCELVEEIASRPLARNRPLWEQWMIEGLEGGRVAALTKIHHSLADGVSSAEMLQRALSSQETASDAPAPSTWQPEPVPSKLARIGSALADLRFLVRAGPRTLRSLLRGLRLRRERHRQGAEDPPGPYQAPQTSMNRLLSPQRRVALASVGLAEAKAIRAALGCTINDVVLATVAGALRRYLVEKDDLPDRPLHASIPVSTRTDAHRGMFGNSTGAWGVELPTQLPDPLERLQTIQRSVRTAKEEFEDTIGARLPDWMELFPPIVLRQIFSRLPRVLLRLGRPPMANLIVSNVPGPREPLFYEGARMTDFFSVGPLLEGVGLNVTAWSYAGQLNFTLLSCRDAVPDLWTLAEGIGVAFEELLKAAAATAPSTAAEEAC